MNARPLLFAVAANPVAPTITSEKPSPFTSPADPTETPKFAFAWLDSAIHAGARPSPLEEPRKREARPSSVWPLSNFHAPTITSENPSPFTSPAVATEYPKFAVA